MATFPTYACIALEGYSDSVDYGVITSATDEGIGKSRPRFTRSRTARNVTINVKDKAERLMFDAWMRNDLGYGVGWFSLTDPVDGLVKQARIVGGKVNWTSPGRVWKASCEIETLG